MNNKNYHVYQVKSGWAVKGSSAKRVVKTFSDKQSAVSLAVGIAKNKGANVVVHNRDMKVSKMYKYGGK